MIEDSKVQEVIDRLDDKVVMDHSYGNAIYAKARGEYKMKTYLFGLVTILHGDGWTEYIFGRGRR